MSALIARATELLPFLTLAAIGLAVLLYWTRGNGHEEVTTEEFSRAQEATHSLLEEFCLARRLFELDDVRFISRQPSQQARRVFLEYRKTLALTWLRQLRRQLTRLKELHLRLASYTNDPSPKVDLGFLTNYVIFATACDILIVLVWIRGPFKAGMIASYTLSSLNELCALFSHRLENINAGLLNPARQTNVA